MQFFSEIAESFGQYLLDEHMDVLRAHIKVKRAARKIRKNPLQPIDQLIGLILTDNSLRAEHGGVRHTALDILCVHSTVKMNGRIEIVRNLTYRAVRAACPHLSHTIFPLIFYYNFEWAAASFSSCNSPPIYFLCEGKNYFLFFAFTCACTLIGRPKRLMNPAESA